MTMNQFFLADFSHLHIPDSTVKDFTYLLCFQNLVNSIFISISFFDYITKVITQTFLQSILAFSSMVTGWLLVFLCKV